LLFAVARSFTLCVTLLLHVVADVTFLRVARYFTLFSLFTFRCCCWWTLIRCCVALFIHVALIVVVTHCYTFDLLRYTYVARFAFSLLRCVAFGLLFLPLIPRYVWLFVRYRWTLVCLTFVCCYVRCVVVVVALLHCCCYVAFVITFTLLFRCSLLLPLLFTFVRSTTHYCYYVDLLRYVAFPFENCCCYLP